MRMKRKLVGIIVLVVALVVCNVSFAAASEADSEITFVLERVASHLEKAGYSTVGNYSVSNSLEMINLENNTSRTLYFLFEENNIIGRMYVDNINDSYYSYLVFDDYAELQSYYADKQMIGLYGLNDCLILSSGQTVSILENPNDVSLNLQNYSMPAYTFIEKQYDVNFSGNNSRSAQYFLPVGHVANVTINGVGKCWAATVAAKVNYQTSDNNLTATDVHNAYINSSWYQIHDNTNVDNWYIDSCRIYGVTLLDFEGMISESGAVYALSNGKPIILWITRSGGGHSVVLCGIDEDAAYWEFTLRDPNYANYVYVTMPNDVFSNPSSFSYAASSTVVYTSVNSSYY